MKHVDDLTNLELDCLIAYCKKLSYEVEDGVCWQVSPTAGFEYGVTAREYKPSTDSVTGLALLQEQRIGLMPTWIGTAPSYKAFYPDQLHLSARSDIDPMTAVARAYVLKHYGCEIDDLWKIVR